MPRAAVERDCRYRGEHAPAKSNAFAVEGPPLRLPGLIDTKSDSHEEFVSYLITLHRMIGNRDSNRLGDAKFPQDLAPLIGIESVEIDRGFAFACVTKHL